MTAVLEARNLTKTFTARFPSRESFTALSNVTFEVREGEVFAFLGPNGAGKTTALNILLGFLTPTSGECRVFGLDPRDHNARSRVGFLPENYAFYSAFTAPLLLDYFARLLGVPKSERRNRIDELIDRVGLADARRRSIGKFSRGMRQRLGIAQALLNRPQLLILDEPTSGFDPIGRHMVRDMMLDLKRTGVSIMLSSHILSEVEAICDRVVIIDRGRVIKEGSLRDVLGEARGYEIAFRDTINTLADLRQSGEVESDGACRIMADDEADAQRLIDKIRAADGVIVRYQAIGRSLEEAFIEGIAGKLRQGEERQ